MSTPPENTRGPEAAGRENSGSGATALGPASDPSQGGPWATHPATGQHERLSPPAPMIELDTPVQTEPVKPLGPRRLARLQREMAEHTREVQEAERNNGGAVDDALLAKQQRLADLAVRAAATNDRDRRDAQRALAADEESPGSQEAAAAGSRNEAATDSVDGTGAPRTNTATSDAAEPDTRDAPAAPGGISVTFPGAPARKAEGVVLGSGGVNPAAWPSAPVDGGPGPATTQIPIYTAPETSVPVAPGTNQAPAPTNLAAEAADTESAPAEAGERAPGAAASSSPEDGAHQAPPGTPVRAVDAQGLHLLDAGAYKRRGTGLRWLIGLLLVVLAALAVVLVMFIL